VSLNKLASEVVPASAGCLCDGAGVLVGRTNRGPSFMTVTPHFYQNVRWPLLLLRHASVAVEVAGAIQIFSAYFSLVKRLNTSFLNCDIPLLVFLLSYRYRDIYKQSSHTPDRRTVAVCSAK